ncbi:DNA repair protein complementing XP-G cells-like [Tropilaelaps mercedesae]|uniref:DNA repair protein complementing XP-G cells-like n=1 Tax=Tropilaelaps mercedesae TaxID=418985 RepID=A0A1V9XAH5_9ACAR|nr:DNA repair protein complementing XP-G cells-like [Tropilaelaps mercedesae]
MGVAGLWQLLDPTGRPVRLETLEGKVLAIDISIWLNQLVKGYRAPGGVSVDNAHLLGLFQRVCKLLHFKIRPVFVFDGEAPALKYQALATRKRRREDGDEAIRAATKKMLQTYVQQKLLGEANPKLPKLKPSRHVKAEAELFRLPDLSHNLSSSGDESSLSDSAVDVVRDADLASIKIDSDEFRSLPLEMQHNFLVAIKNHEKGVVDVDDVPADSDDFSTYQMDKVLKRSKLQARIEEMRREMSDGMLQMASDASVKLLLRVTPFQKAVGAKSENEAKRQENDGMLLKKPKLEKLSADGDVADAVPEPTKEQRVENFLVSQWLEGAQRGEEGNETLKKAVELVRDEVDVISNSGASSDDVEKPHTCEVRKRLLSTGGKVSAEEAMRHVGALDRPTTKEASRDSVLSDNLSMEVGHGSIVSASTSRVMQSDEQFDEGSRGRPASDSDEEKANGTPEQALIEDSTEQTCNTDMLNADLEVSETANSVFRMDDTAERSKSQEDDANSAQSSQSCKLTEVMGSPVIKEVSFLGGPQSSLNSNDDIVLPQNLSQYASKNPSRCNSNSQGFVPGLMAGSAALADNPTDFHQALEIIREQERRQSECAAEVFVQEPDSRRGNSLLAGERSRDPVVETAAEGTAKTAADPVASTAEKNNNNVKEKGDSADQKAEASAAPAADGGHSLPNGAGGLPSNGNTTSDSVKDVAKDERDAADDFLKNLSPEFVASQKQQLKARAQALQSEINRLQRQTAEVTSSMADDCAELLQLFGVPCVRAPREAEAQCAALEHAGLVQGVVTDDSDIFLFGGQTVYRNLFSQNAHCEVYTAKTIETRLKLGQNDLIGFAMLTGSDYTNGIENVGPVTACEILAEFKGETSQDVLKTLRDFKEWWMLAQKGAVPPKNSVRTRFIKLRLDDKFPSEVVFNAYRAPSVETFKEKFSWSRPDLDSLRSFASRKFNWPQDKTDGYLLPLLKKFEDHSVQPRIDGFLLPGLQKRENLFPSKRLKAAVGKIRGPASKVKQATQREAKLSESSSDESD